MESILLLLLLNPVLHPRWGFALCADCGYVRVFAMLCAWECYYVSVRYYNGDDLLFEAASVFYVA